VSKASLRKRTTFSLMRLVILACVAGPQLALCQGQKRASQRVVADSCLPSSEFQLRGVSLGDDTTLALGTLGKALRTKTDSGVDDGGFFERRTIEYRDLSIVAVRGAIDQLTTRSARVTTPSGLRPGLSADEVRRILLSKGVTFPQGADTVKIADCEGGAAYLNLAFDHAHHVRRVKILAMRP